MNEMNEIEKVAVLDRLRRVFETVDYMSADNPPHDELVLMFDARNGIRIETSDNRLELTFVRKEFS